MAISARNSIDKKENPRSKRKQIVRAAVKVFLQSGYEGTSMSKVAESAGVIKATIYSHFKDKQELFKAIIEEVTLSKAFDDMSAELQHVSTANVFNFLKAHMMERRKDAQFKGLIRLVIGESGRFPELAELFLRTVSLRGIDLLTRYFEKHPELKLSDPKATAHICIGSLVYWMIMQEILGAKKFAPMDISRITDTLRELIVQE